MEGGDYELINLQEKISGGQRRGNGSKLSIRDYPDLMERIKRPMGGNRLFASAQISVTLTCDVAQEGPPRRSRGEGLAPRATRWRCPRFHYRKDTNVNLEANVRQ